MEASNSSITPSSECTLEMMYDVGLRSDAADACRDPYPEKALLNYAVHVLKTTPTHLAVQSGNVYLFRQLMRGMENPKDRTEALTTRDARGLLPIQLVPSVEMVEELFKTGRVGFKLTESTTLLDVIRGEGSSTFYNSFEFKRTVLRLWHSDAKSHILYVQSHYDNDTPSPLNMLLLHNLDFLKLLYEDGRILTREQLLQHCKRIIGYYEVWAVPTDVATLHAQLMAELECMPPKG